MYAAVPCTYLPRQLICERTRAWARSQRDQFQVGADRRSIPHRTLPRNQPEQTRCVDLHAPRRPECAQGAWYGWQRPLPAHDCPGKALHPRPARRLGGWDCSSGAFVAPRGAAYVPREAGGCRNRPSSKPGIAVASCSSGQTTPATTRRPSRWNEPGQVPLPDNPCGSPISSSK